MLLTLTSDQELLRDTTARFLDEHAPVAEIRRLRDDPAGFSPELWRRGADLGWTSLLVDERHGGGSVSGVGLVDLSLVAHEFGRRAAPGPLIPTNVVAALVSAAATDGPAALLSRLLSGEATAAWCLAEPAPAGGPWTVGLEVRVDGDQVVLDGSKRPVEAAATADVLLVTGRSSEGLTNVLVPPDTPGVRVRPLTSVDLTRRYAAVDFADVRVPMTAILGEAGRAGPAVEWGLQIALAINAAESVGAMDAAFEMTVEWAFERYSFGRPLASYQELKHRFADMKTWLEGSHAIADAAVAAVASGSPDAAELASAAKAFIGEYGAELVQDCVQIHGGIGVTFEHDLHLFLRRVVANRSTYGTPAEHRQRVADLLDHEEVAP